MVDGGAARSPIAASGRAVKRRAGRNGSAGGRVERTELPLAGHREQATKMPGIAEILALPAAPTGATAADFCAVLAELHGESRQARRARFALPISCHQRQESGGHHRAPARPENPCGARLCARIGTSGFLPDFRPSAREERGCPSAVGARTHRILLVFNPFRPSPQCRKKSDGFLPDLRPSSREERGCPSAFATAWGQSIWRLSASCA
jgi:hypothetical protein